MFAEKPTRADLHQIWVASCLADIINFCQLVMRGSGFAGNRVI